MKEILVKCLSIGAVLLSSLVTIVTQNGTAFKGTVMLAVLLSPFVVAWYINHSGPGHLSINKTSAEIRQLREKIRDYRPYQWTARDAGDGFEIPSKVRLGVFGVQDSGKSSFLNSLYFAFKGSWEQVYTPNTIFREPAKLSDYVTTVDTPGLVDLSIDRVPEVIAEITGILYEATDEKIDCPIFILRYSAATGTEHGRSFLESFVPEVREELGAYPIMVVTFANSIPNQENILGNFTSAGMERSNVFFIENYTAENHEMDSKKHIALLKILEACIKRADDNIAFQLPREIEIPEEELPREIETPEEEFKDNRIECEIM